MIALAAENAELHLQLAEAQEQCIETAVDARDLQSEIAVLQARLSQLERERSRWRRAAGRAAAKAKVDSGNIDSIDNDYRAHLFE